MLRVDYFSQGHLLLGQGWGTFFKMSQGGVHPFCWPLVALPSGNSHPSFLKQYSYIIYLTVFPRSGFYPLTDTFNLRMHILESTSNFLIVSSYF